MTIVPARVPTITTEISFDGSGLYDGAHDDLTARRIKGSLTVTRGKQEALPDGQPLTPDSGWGIENRDRLLSPANPSSDLYRRVRPGKPFRHRMTAGADVDYDAAIPYDAILPYDGVGTVTLVTGKIAQPTQSGDPRDPVVTFRGAGRFDLLQSSRLKVSTPLYQDVRVDQAIGHLMDAIGWPAEDRLLAISETSLRFWWLDSAAPFDALNDLLATAGMPAAVFERGDGTLVFQNRSHRTTADRSTISQAVFSDQFGGQVLYEAGIDYDADVDYDGGSGLYHVGVEDVTDYSRIYNAASMTVRRRAVQSVQKVWEYGEALVLAAGETLDVIAGPFSDPVTGAVAPASGTDYTVSAGSLASAPTLVTQNAQRVTIRWVAGGGGATVLGVTSDGPQLRAQPATVVSESEAVNSLDASDSIDEHGLSIYEVPALGEIDQADAVALCDAAVAYSRQIRPQVRVTVENYDGRHLLYQMPAPMGLDVSDCLTVRSAHLGYGVSGEPGDFWVEMAEYSGQPRDWYVTWTCSQVQNEPGGAMWEDGLWEDGLWAR